MVFLLIFLFAIYWLFFDNSLPNSKYSNIEAFSKRNFGATVVNLTPYTVKVSEYLKMSDLPPNKTTKQIGIFDADSIIINRPMVYNLEKYNNKVFKFCDYSSIKLTEKNGEIVIEPSFFSNICKLADDFDIFDNMDEAFR